MVTDRAYFDSLTEQVIGCAFVVGNTLGHGFLEKVYENAMVLELQKASLPVETQKSISVFYGGDIVGDYVADIIIDNDLIVELKAIKSIENVHFVQCQNYLKATGIKLGLVINFGGEK